MDSLNSSWRLEEVFTIKVKRALRLIRVFWKINKKDGIKCKVRCKGKPIRSSWRLIMSVI